MNEREYLLVMCNLTTVKDGLESFLGLVDYLKTTEKKEKLALEYGQLYEKLKEAEHQCVTAIGKTYFFAEEKE